MNRSVFPCPMDMIKIPYRKGENINELVRYTLSNILPYDKEDFYYKYERVGKYLEVKYIKEKEIGKKAKKDHVNYQRLFFLAVMTVIMMFLMAINSWCLQVKNNHLKKYYNNRINQINRLYHQRKDLILYRNVKKKNQKMIVVLQKVLMLPLHIQHINITNSVFEIVGFSQESSASDVSAFFRDISILSDVKEIMQNNITYCYIRGVL